MDSLISLDVSISNKRGIRSDIIITMYTRIPVFNANYVDPDQTPRSGSTRFAIMILFYRMLGINGLSL